jgi:hypothetical protein
MSVMSVRNPFFRLALLKVCRYQCVWCREPLGFAELEIEHLIYKEASAVELSGWVSLHNLPTPYDVHETYNLAASCGDCNGKKGKRKPPDAPIVAYLFEEARDRAPEVEAEAALLSKRRDMAPLLAFVESNRDNPDVIKRISEYVDKVKIVADAGQNEVVFLTSDTQMTFKAGKEVRVENLNSILITSFAIAEADLHLRGFRRTRDELFHPGDNFGKITYWLWRTDKSALWRMMADYMAEVRLHNPRAPEPALAFSKLLAGLKFALPSYVSAKESKLLVAEAAAKVPSYFGGDMEAE